MHKFIRGFDAKSQCSSGDDVILKTLQQTLEKQCASHFKLLLIIISKTKGGSFARIYSNGLSSH